MQSWPQTVGVVGYLLPSIPPHLPGRDDEQQQGAITHSQEDCPLRDGGIAHEEPIPGGGGEERENAHQQFAPFPVLQ